MPPKLWQPVGLLAGFNADVEDSDIGLLHGGENWAGGALFIGAHVHVCWELYLQAHGRTTWRVDRQVFELGPNDVLAVPPRVEHAMVERARSRHHFFYAAIDFAIVASRHPAMMTAWDTAAPLICRGAGALQMPFRQLVRELGTSQPLQREGLLAAVDLLAIAATRALVLGAAGKAADRAHPAVTAARRLLDEHPERRWSIRELGASVGLSPTYLVELFTRDAGMPPHRYLTERRVERAAELLAGTELTIGRIAADLGFASGSHLARVVRTATGLTPTQLRARARGSGPRDQDATHPVGKPSLEV